MWYHAELKENLSSSPISSYWRLWILPLHPYENRVFSATWRQKLFVLLCSSSTTGEACVPRFWSEQRVIFNDLIKPLEKSHICRDITMIIAWFLLFFSQNCQESRWFLAVPRWKARNLFWFNKIAENIAYHLTFSPSEIKRATIRTPKSACGITQNWRRILAHRLSLVGMNKVTHRFRCTRLSFF